MYICKNCGMQYQSDEMTSCVRCQAPRGEGSQFCPCCGNQMPPVRLICLNCGVDTTSYGMPKSPKSKIVAGLLAFVLGVFGVHNFYLGYIAKAVIQLVGFWGFEILYVGGLIWSETAHASNMAMLIAIPGLLGAIGIQIWAYVDGFRILCGKMKRDGKGRLLVK